MTGNMLNFRDPVTGKFIGVPIGGGGTPATDMAAAPIGAIVMWSSTTAPVGWHLCNGTAHGSSDLEAILGSPNTPDLRDRFILGDGARPIGERGGAETHTLTEAEMPHHSHPVGPSGDGVNLAVAMVQQRGGGGFGGWAFEPGATDGTPEFLRTFVAAPRGGGQPHNNMPPFHVLTFIIKKAPEASAEMRDTFIGTVVAFRGTVAPAGWLLCDGAAIPSTYPDLIAMMGPNTPDLRDKFLIGAGGSHAVGDTGGAASVTLTEAQMPAHDHGGTTPTEAHSGWIRGVFNGGGNLERNHMITRGDGSTGFIDHPDGTPFPDHRHPIPADGGGQPHENRPPFHALTYIIKAAATGNPLDLDARFVNSSGDTMTGDLVIDNRDAIRGLHLRGALHSSRLVTHDDPVPGGSGSGVWVQRLDSDGVATALDNVVVAEPVTGDHAATKRYVDARTTPAARLYAEGKGAASGNHGPTTPAWYPAASVTLTEGSWMVQCGLILVQHVVLDTGWCGVAQGGVGLLPNSAGAAIVADVGVQLARSALSAPTLVVVPAGQTKIIHPGWWPNGSSRFDVLATTNGPAGYTSAIRISH